MINDLEVLDEWKIQISTAINLIFSNETHNMHSESDNIEIMISNKTDEIIKELFDSRFQKHQKWLEESLKGSEFVFGGVNLLHYKWYKISLNSSGSYKDSPKW